MAYLPRPGTRWSAAVSAVLALLALAPVAAHALPDAFGLVPQDAELVVLVPNPAAFSGKVAQLKTSLGLPMAAMDDVLAMFKAETGMMQGVDDGRPMVMVIQGLSAAFADGGEPRPTILVPVSDYAAFVGNYGGDAAAAIAELDMPKGGDGYAKRLGAYAAMSPEQEIVEGYKPLGATAAMAGRFGKEGAGLLDRSDLIVYMDLERLGPALAPKLNELVDEMADGIAGGVPGMKDAFAGYADFAREFLTQGSTLLIGMDLNQQGVGMSKVLRFRPDAPWTESMRGGPGLAGPQLARLPDQSFIVAGAFDLRSLPMEGIHAAFMKMIPEPMRQQMVGPMYDKIGPMLAEMNAAAFMLRPPPPGAMMGGGLFNALYAYDVKDAGRFAGLTKEYIAGLNGFKQPMMMPVPGTMEDDGGEAPSMTYSTSVTENVFAVEGVPVDQFTVGVTMPQEMMLQMGPAAGFLSMFTNYQGFMAATGSTFLMTTVADAELIGQALRAAGAPAGLGAGGPIAAVRQRALPAGSVAEFFLSLAGIAESANGFLGMMGQPPIEVPAGLPPIASGIAMAGGEISYRLYVPAETSKFAVNTVQGLMASMAGPPGEYGEPMNDPWGE